MKNIVILSDGTGNGAAKRNRTNVRRLYSALDLHRPDDQIAFYDDGVGSQEFLPLKVVGAVFGWGLKRNVIKLYKYLCRNYESGDIICLFGFSRGAFTVRQLAGLITSCGLVTCTGCIDEQWLHKKAKQNYRAYHSSYNGGLLSKLFRWLARKMRALFDKEHEQQWETVTPEIEFMGVWDTVDAYGLPIDELAILWHWIMYPLYFPDRELSVKVKKACHSLSIDDERLTFHLVLWDESNEEALVNQNKIKPGRIEQVWFAGVHCDVGGGYPMSNLALIHSAGLDVIEG